MGWTSYNTKKSFKEVSSILNNIHVSENKN